MELKIILGVIVLVSSVFALINCSLSDKHDVLIKKNCTKFKSEIKNRTKLETYQDSETYSGMCKVDNRYYECAKVKHETKSRIIIDTYTEYVATPECCDGYEEFDQKCAPICENQCENGFCSAPNQCECNQNYTLTEISSVQHCEPICDNCIFGNCIEPNVCKCWDGYEQNSELIGCEPFCKSNCTYGQCIEPDKCVCIPNYYFNESMDACMPICSPFCYFGECTAPDRCECYEGYQFENGFCEPICEPDCVNGKCDEPNVCSCEEDYYQLNEWNVCHPICDFNEHCTNGNCSAPGRYDCYNDFELSPGFNCTCLPILTDNLQYAKSSGFNWYITIMLLAIFAVTIIIMIIGLIKFHFRRKVNYCLKDEVDWPIRYYGYDDEGAITSEIIESRSNLQCDLMDTKTFPGVYSYNKY